MRRTIAIIACLLVAGLGVAGAASALPADKHVTLEADDGESCTSEQKADCFRVVNGTLDGFTQGMQVHIELENVGSNPHNVYAAQSSDADSNRVDTPADAAINGSDTIDPGQSTNLTFQIPSDAEGLYLWCDVGTHETLGMWLNASVSEAPEGAQDGDGDNGTSPPANDSGDDTDDGDLIPSPGAIVLLGVLSLAALAGRRDA